jgi:hypothetical protein
MFSAPRTALAPTIVGAGGGPARGGTGGRRGLLASLLGVVPVAVPPHVFEVDATVLRYAGFARRSGNLELERFASAELPAETFQPGPLGGPLRGRESFDRALDEVLGARDKQAIEGSLVLPDRWLRLLFTELEPELGMKPDDEVLRFKLKRLVPFRVDELRLRASVVPSFPGQEGWRLLYAFGVEQLLRDLETAFESRGVRIGQIASRTLYLVSLLRASERRSVLVVNLEGDGYSLGYVADSVPYVFRYRADSVDLADAGQAAQVAQDLRILLGFIGEHMPRHGIEEALVCGAPESAEPWVDLLRDRFELPSRVLEARDLPAALPRGQVPCHHAAPLVAAATREVA